MKVGVLGGTFDPIHLGHLIVAEDARERLGLEVVYFVPAGQPWLKARRRRPFEGLLRQAPSTGSGQRQEAVRATPELVEGQITPGPHRLAMLRLALAGHPAFKVATLELERPGPSYTVETMQTLRDELGKKAELFFLLGWDALAELPRWREPARLLGLCPSAEGLCQVVALRRPGSLPPWDALEAALPGARDRIKLLEVPLIEISSSDIRERVRQGLSIRYLVPEAVGRYIQEHHLYGA
ncbi:MAG: nicotinate-nucleotide adenylyltransferase [Chloroflexota bacterium]|nr:nicotinate-nucleotide adenylyltransferase [Chloroflexota bacterium]